MRNKIFIKINNCGDTIFVVTLCRSPLFKPSVMICYHYFIITIVIIWNKGRMGPKHNSPWNKWHFITTRESGVYPFLFLFFWSGGGPPYAWKQLQKTCSKRGWLAMVVGEDDGLVEWCTVERVMACCKRQEQGGERFSWNFPLAWGAETFS